MQHVEARIPVRLLAPRAAGEQAYRDEGDQHRGARAPEVEPQGERKVVGLPEPVGKGGPGERGDEHYDEGHGEGAAEGRRHLAGLHEEGAEHFPGLVVLDLEAAGKVGLERERRRLSRLDILFQVVTV